MELASMLAGERFSDHPRSVSRVVAAFMRGYNDVLDDDRRQNLYEYAARTVGTAGSSATEELRLRRLLEWADEMWACRSRWSIAARLRRSSANSKRLRNASAAAHYAIRSIGRISDETHAAALAMVDELIEIRSGSRDGRRQAGSRARLSSPANTIAQTATASQVQTVANV